MSGSIATAFVSIKADTKGFKSQVESSVEDTAQSAGAKFAGIFGAVAFGAGLKRTIDAASDLNETVSKTKQIFDQSAQQIEDWAQDAAKNLGLSKRAAMDGAATFAIFGQAAGLAGQDLVGFSTDLVQLASDLASFNNTSPEEAIQAIGAALRGESEPIRAYGVLLDDATLKAKAFEMGIYDGTGVLTQQQRVLAAQSEILAQTTTQQGDFARTADGAANSQRILAAEAENAAASLGSSFLPIYTRVVQIVGALARVFASLPGPIQAAAVALVGITVLAGPIRGVATLIGDLAGQLRNLSAQSRNTALAVGAIGVVALAAYALEAKNARDRTNELDNALRSLSEGTDAEALRGLYDTVFEKAFVDGQNLTEIFGDLADANVEGVRRVRDLVAANEDFSVEMFDQEWILRSLDSALADYETRQTKATETAETYGTKIEETTEKVDDATEANKALSKALEPTRQAFDDAADAADALAEAIDRVFGGAMNLEEATRNLQQAGDDLTASFEENGKTLDINTEAGRRNRAAIDDQVTGILDYAVAMLGAGKTTDEATDAVAFLTEGLKEQLRQAGLTEEEINGYLETLGLTPENVTTSIELANEDVSKEKLEAILNDLGDIDAGAAAEIQALVDQGRYDEAMRKLRGLEVGRKVIVDLIAGRGLTLNAAGGGGGRVYLSANGDYFPARPGGYMVNLAEAGQAEAVLPLERPSRLAEMLNDPRIGGPIAEAMGGGGGGGVATITAAPASPTVIQFVINDRVVQEMLVAADRQTRGAR
jgi:hypothetical protein